MRTRTSDSELYYIDKNGLLVFTEKYHLLRGSCCKNGCRHCPFGFSKDRQEPASVDADAINQLEKIEKHEMD